MPTNGSRTPARLRTGWTRRALALIAAAAVVTIAAAPAAQAAPNTSTPAKSAAQVQVPAHKASTTPGFADTRTMKQDKATRTVNIPGPTGAPGHTNPDAGIHRPAKAIATPPPQRKVGPAATTGPTFANPLSFDGPIPPDPTGAVGPTDAVETVNSSIGFFDRASNTQTFSTSIQTFLNQSSGSFVDPHVIYDQIGHHYLMVVMDNRSQFFLASSPTGTASGSWCYYSIAGGSNMDYPLLGVDNDSVKLTDVTYNSDDSEQTDARAYLLPRNQVESCATVNYTYFTGVRDPGTAGCPIFCSNQLGFHIAPITDASTTGHTNDFVDSYPDGGSHVSFFTYDGSQLRGFQVDTPSYDSPSSAAQQGSGAHIDTGESDIKQAVRWGDGDDEVHVAITSNHDWGNGNVNSTVLWLSMDLDIGGPETLQSLQFGYPGYWYFYPSVVPDKAGNALFNFSLSGGIYPADGVASLPFNSFQISGTTYYPGGGAATAGESKNCTSSPCYRYGDFTSVAQDPTDHTHAYVTGELQGANNQWQTVIGQISN
jgi:hypothetical protein